MKTMVVLMILLPGFVIPASALEYTAPAPPDSVQEWMPSTDDLGNGLQEMVQKAVAYIYPEMTEVWKLCAGVFVSVLIIGIFQSITDTNHTVIEMIGVLVLTSLIALNTKGMIHLAAETVREITEYGKLLLPVLTAALATQGGVSSSAALYAGTAAFNAAISGFLSNVMCPLIYCFLTLSIAFSATGESLLRNMRDLLKSLSGWCLKMILTVFTTYMSITGVVTGATDAAALKATKVSISSFVPVVGSILSEASEAVLLSAGLAKNAAGIYGIFAVLAVFMVPFLRIGIHYLMLKITSGICGIFGVKRMVELIGDFSAAMGMLLAMIGAACLIQLISTVCFMKGIG